MARDRDLGGLRRHCARRRRAERGAEADEARHRRVHAGRYLRHFVDDDGALCLSGRLTLDAGGRLLAAVDAIADRIFDEARRLGAPEATERYRADALVELVTGARATAGDPRALVRLQVDLAALRRGEVRDAETCEIPGLGPIALSAARALMDDALLEAFISDGADVASICRPGRTIPTALRRALEARDPVCVVPGCESTFLLEIDHCHIPFAEGGPLSLANCCRICRHHHRLKTHRGYRLTGAPGRWAWRAPDGTEHTDPTTEVTPSPVGRKRERSATAGEEPVDPSGRSGTDPPKDDELGVHPPAGAGEARSDRPAGDGSGRGRERSGTPPGGTSQGPAGQPRIFDNRLAS